MHISKSDSLGDEILEKLLVDNALLIQRVGFVVSLQQFGLVAAFLLDSIDILIPRFIAGK
jgi:hypothetical protein